MSITFLFGSGADTDACSCLPSGNVFTEALITEKYSKEVKELLNIDTSHFKILYPTSKKIYIQTIYHNQEGARNILTDDEIDLCIKYYNGDKNVSFDEIKGFCSKWYEVIKNPKSDSEQKIKDFFLKNAVLFDALDEKFNSLRYQNPNSNAKRVMIAYASVFILMVKCLYDVPLNFVWSYDNVFDKLKEEYSVAPKCNCYYKTVKKIQGEYFIVTPNYTDLAKKITQKDVVYLHGNLSWFEDLKTLSVYDCIEERDKINLSNRIIPFIMIPSGVKPIICGKQISQFYKFISALNKSEVLCIIGYKFNSEDNHINSLVADWLKKERSQIVYFNFQTSDDFGVDITKLSWLDSSNTIKVISSDQLQTVDIGRSKIISIQRLHLRDHRYRYLRWRGQSRR